MGLSEEQRHQAAQDIFEAEATQNWTTPVSLRGDADVEDAYAIGALVTELKVAAGRVVKGHKVGLTSKPMRAMFDTDEPDYGTLVDDMFLDEGSLISRSHMNRPLVEIELAFVLGDELGGADTTAADVMQATACVVPAIEIVDGRFAAGSTNPLVDSIADAASCGAIILGASSVSLHDIDPRHVAGALYVDGEVEMTGTAAAVMGNPVNAVAWLARKLAAFDVAMQAGHVVLSGSFIAAVPIDGAASYVADFGPLGEISFRVSD